MILGGSPDELFSTLMEQFPGTPKCPADLHPQMLPYQLIALYGLASQYNRLDAAILEIGTGDGASAFMLSRAAPSARIVSLTISHREAAQSGCRLGAAGCTNVDIVLRASWDYFRAEMRLWDMIFVDGDHNHIERDLQWWERLNVGGLMLFHDYSPMESEHPSPIVFAMLNMWLRGLRRERFDVLIADDTATGMAGLYK